MGPTARSRIWNCWRPDNPINRRPPTLGLRVSRSHSVMPLAEVGSASLRSPPLEPTTRPRPPTRVDAGSSRRLGPAAVQNGISISSLWTLPIRMQARFTCNCRDLRQSRADRPTAGRVPFTRQPHPDRDRHGGPRDHGIDLAVMAPRLLHSKQLQQQARQASFSRCGGLTNADSTGTWALASVTGARAAHVVVGSGDSGRGSI